MSKIKFTIDGKSCQAEAGQTLLDAAAENGVYIPFLCHMKGVIPAGSCRVCTVKMNGRPVAACTTPIGNDCAEAKIENNTPQLNEMRKTIIELLFVEGNHFCPSCEKSGNCELQALAYRYQMMVPQFPYTFPMKKVDATSPKLYIDRNRCILCKKCIRIIKTDDDKSYFAFYKRGKKLEIHIDHELAAKMNDALAQKAMDICPVGAILKKEKGYDVPIGKRKYDKKPIGSDIEKI
ncbi:MAG TPA: 2Fe-2S iron-sulfur cluster-binding protein [Bacteroidales bacterium]|nr:2Fe-2S iron-sulfur cluster-binding protein [Bacteroidales bacterium]HPS16868.1 2Fe-2S iron-sulfur cluster-binding protein [Bacteroidales bacterium]